MHPLGWGIAGFGWVARDFAAPAMSAAGAKVVGVADPGLRAQADALSAGFDVHADIAALLSDQAVEAIYVATPNDRHRELVEQAARAGKAVLCEKPMASTLADAEAIAGAVRRTGIVYGTAFDQRHHPAHAAMRAAIGDGAIGTVTAIRIVYACWLGSDWSQTAGAENWRADPRRAGGGALMDLAPHGLDLIDFLLGEPVTDIAGLIQRRVQDYPVDDGAMIVGRTEAGVLASLHVAYNTPETLPRRRLELVGTRGMLIAENTMGQDGGGELRRIGPDGRSEPLGFETTSPFQHQMHAFARAVRGGNPGVFDVERDLWTMRLLDRAYGDAPCR